MRDRFYQFSWRPRPPTLLGEEQIREVARNLRKYSEKYAKEDDVLLAQVQTTVVKPFSAAKDKCSSRSWAATCASAPTRYASRFGERCWGFAR